MRRVVVLSGLWRTPLWAGETFDPGAIGVREAHHALAVHAVKCEWDASVLVVQDDVEPFEIGEHHGDITSHWPSFSGQWGWMRRPDHVCPKAFTATPAGWRRLVWDWSKEGKTCELWAPDYVSTGPADVRRLPLPHVHNPAGVVGSQAP